MYSSYFWQLLKSGENYETGLSSYAMWNICLDLLEQFIPDYIIIRYVLLSKIQSFNTIFVLETLQESRTISSRPSGLAWLMYCVRVWPAPATHPAESTTHILALLVVQLKFITFSFCKLYKTGWPIFLKKLNNYT